MSDADVSRNSRRRPLVTPEGVNLQVELADMGARLTAFIIDLSIVFLSPLLVFILLFAFLISDVSMEIVVILFILFVFFIQNFYFMAFEMGRKAATPGKRLLKIRVASRTEPRLSASAVFARNAMRQIELFLPMSFMFSNAGDQVDGWLNLLGLIWAGIFMLFPLFNRDRLRAGDIIAGTWVINAPKPVLDHDLASEEVIGRDRFAFTPTQIAAYGVKELHVLEDVLRQNQPQTLHDVAQRIRGKIGWVGTETELDVDFLRAYYKALRGRLESQLLMGVRRKDKFDKG